MSEELPFDIIMTDEAKEDLERQLQEWFNQVFKEKTVIIDCPYALAVEYGTTPSKANPLSKEIVIDPETGQEVSRTKLKFRDWVERKEGATGKERVRKGDAIYHHVMEKGAAPHPYIRPAMEDMFRTYPEDAVGLTSEEDVVTAYAYFLADRMRFYLKKNKSEATNMLSKSIKVVPSLVAENALTLKEVDLHDDKYHWKPGQARQ